MGSQGKELPQSVMENKSQVIVVSNPSVQQTTSQITASQFAATRVIQTQPQDHVVPSTNHNVQVNRPLHTQLHISGGHTGPIASMMEDMQVGNCLIY